MPVRKREYKHKGNSKPVWEYNFSHAGQRYKQSGFRKRKDAEIAETKAKKEVILENRPIRHTTTALLGDVVRRFMSERELGVAPGTYQREFRRAKPILKRFRSFKAHRINAAHIQRYVRDRKGDGMSNRSINLELTLLRSIFKFAIQQRAAVHNPAKEISNLKEIRDEHWIPTEDELIRFVKEAEGTRSAVVLVPWIWFRAYTGHASDGVGACRVAGY